MRKLLIGLFLVALAGCGGGPGDNVEVEHHEGLTVRYFDGAERYATAAEIYAIWMDTEACVTGSSGLAVPPVVDFLPVEVLHAHGKGDALGLAYGPENRVELPESSLQRKPNGWRDQSTIRHEFVHLLLHQSGMSRNQNAAHEWGAADACA